MKMTTMTMMMIYLNLVQAGVISDLEAFALVRL